MSAPGGNGLVQVSQETPPDEDVLVTVGLSKAFGGVRAVDSVSLAVKRGSISALIGPNGAGKTTFFNLVTGRLRADHGSVVLHGRDVTHLSMPAVARHGMARSFQDLRVFASLTALENLEVYALNPSATSLWLTIAAPWRQRRAGRLARDRSLQVLESLRIADLRHTPVADLSFAQQKLVSLGRLLVRQPELVLLDEPASGLDEREREELMSTIGRLAAEGITVCFVEHNLDVVRGIAKWVYFMTEGRLAQQGPPTTIFGSPELAEVYFGVRSDTTGPVHG
jgi:branched-chain amino acid transport system permease protein